MNAPFGTDDNLLFGHMNNQDNPLRSIPPDLDQDSKRMSLDLGQTINQDMRMSFVYSNQSNGLVDLNLSLNQHNGPTNNDPFDIPIAGTTDIRCYEGNDDGDPDESGSVWEIKRYSKLSVKKPSKQQSRPSKPADRGKKGGKKGTKGKENSPDQSNAGDVQESLLSTAYRNFGINDNGSANPVEATKKKYRYYWRLCDPLSIAPDVLDLYYPVFAFPGDRNADFWVNNPEDAPSWSYNLYFIPERFWRQYIFVTFKDKAYEPPTHLTFPRGTGCVILDARGIRFRGDRKAYVEVVELRDSVKTMEGLYKLLKVGQSAEQLGKAREILQEYLSGEFGEVTTTYGTAFSFDEPAELSKTCEYVRLRPDDVTWLLTTGGCSSRNRTEIYIPRAVIENWASIDESWLEEVGWIADEDGPPIDARDVHEQMDSQKFWVRNGDGARVLITLQNRLLSSTWKELRDCGISFREGSGWARTLDPEINLCLVPVDASKGAAERLLRIVVAAQQKCESRQIPYVLSREAFDELIEAQGAHFTLMSKSPFNHYETWIETAKYEEYLKLFPHREPPNPQQIGVFQKLLAGNQEYKSAAKYRASKKLVSKTEVDEKEWELAADKQMQLAQVPRSEGGADNIEGPDTFLAIRVNAEKIRQAIGKRKGVASQRSVMGTSATEFSNELEWKNRTGDNVWPATTFATAEWLHRSAFSWGGLGDPGKFHTSQLRENMIFGTSECNSIMTRYEKAWQQLLLRESDYRKSLGNKAAAGGILVTDTGAYIAEHSTREPWRSKPVTPTTPCICSVMEYTLLVQDFKPLSPHSGILKQEFYPFECGFFTVLEHEIDTMILDEMYPQTLNVKRSPAADLEEEEVSQHDDDNANSQQVPLNPRKTVVRYREYVWDRPVQKQERVLMARPPQRDENVKPKLVELTERSNDSSRATPSSAENATSLPFRTLETAQAAENRNPQLKSVIAADQAALQAHHDVWKDMNSPGPTEVDGITLTNVQMVVGPSETQSPLTDGALQEPPDQFVLKGAFKLFGVIPVELCSLQSPTILGIVQRVDLPGDLSLGKLIPSLANSPINAIKLCKSTLTYRSHRTLTTDAGLTLSTTVYLSGFLQPVNAVLRDIFGQKDPRIDLSGLISTDPDCLSYIPTPIGFVLRGELPDTSVKIFDVLEITHLGLDIMATRIGSKGGYDYAYGFFGRGRICDIAVQWYIRKHHDMYRILVSTQSESWQNVCGIIGVNVENVLFEAAWVGTNISSVSLEVQCSLSLRGANLLMRGSYSKNDLELEGTLGNCTLETLQQLYEEIFKTKVETKTSHQITFSTLSLVVSTQNGLTLHGAVTVDGHTSATATIALTTGGIHITGSIESFDVTDQVKLEYPALNLAITSSSVNVQLSGQIRVSDKHSFSVGVYLDKSRGERLEYAVYGSYQGDFHLRDLIEGVEGSFLDISLQKIAVCASNMEEPNINVKDNILAYRIKQGLQVYAQVESLPAVNGIMRTKESCPLVLCAYYKPGSGDIRPSFGVDLQVSANKMCFDCTDPASLTMGIRMSPKPSLHITSHLCIGGSGLKLQLDLIADVVGASGSAELTGTWNNPFDLCKGLTIKRLMGELGIKYATFISTGMPSKVALGGTFELYDFKGDMTLLLGTNPIEQLIQLEMFNLDVTQLTDVICKLLDINVELSYGRDTFYIRHLLVYVSTGVCIQNRQYPRGLELDVDMTVLGKKATLQAALTSSQAKFFGYIDAFSLGDACVSGARQGDRGPKIEVEISSKVMKLDISGMVRAGKGHLIVDVKIDNCSETFYFLFDIVIADAMKVQVEATLVGSMPKVVKSTEDVVENNGDEKGILGGVAGTSVAGGLYAEASQKVEQLFDRQFKLHALIEQDILDYIIDLVNDHFAKEGDPNRKAILEQEEENAKKELMDAQVSFSRKEEELQRIINDKRTELSSRGSALGDIRKKAEDVCLELESSRMLKEHGQTMKAEVEQRNVEEEEKQKTLIAETAARTARIVAEECRRALMVQKLAKATRDSIEEAKAAAEMELERFEGIYNENAAAEPPAHDPGHVPWQWAREEQMRELERKRASLSKTAADFDAASAGFDLEAYKSLTIKAEELDAAAAKADRALATQRKSMQVNIAAIRDYWQVKLRKFKKQLDEAIESARRAKQEAADAEVEFQREQQEAEKANDINTTPEFKQLQAALKKHSDASVASLTFNNLVHIVNVFGAVYTAPLRFVIKRLGTKFLNIKKIEITGFWTGKKGQVDVIMDVVICFVPFTFKDICFDVTDIVDLFTAIYMKVGEVINEIGMTWLDIAKRGAEAIDAAIRDVENGVEITLIEGKEFIVEVAAYFEELAEGVAEAAKEVAETVVETAEKIGDEVQKVADAVEETAEKVVEEVAEQVQETVRDIEELAEGVSEVVVKGIGTVQKAAHEIDEAVNEVANDIKQAVDDVGEAVDNAASDVVNTLSDAADDIGRGVGEAVQDVNNVLEDIGNSVDDVVCEVAEGVDSVLEDIGNGVEDVAKEVAEGMDSILEDVGTGVGEAMQDVNNALEDIGNGVGDVAHEVAQGVDSVLEDIGTGVGEAMQDVNNVLEGIGNGVEGVANEVAQGMDIVFEDIGRGVGDVAQDVENVGQAIGDFFGSLW